MSSGALIRFVLDPDGVVTPDLRCELPGRGAWVAASAPALTQAVKKSAFSRAFKTRAIAPSGLEATVEAGLATAALNALGLARRVGDAAIGFDQVSRLLRAGDAGVVASASDASEDGRRKLSAAARAGAEGGDAQGKSAQKEPAQVLCFSSEALSGALGRDGIVHVAIKKGVSAERFLREARRYECFGRSGALEAVK